MGMKVCAMLGWWWGLFYLFVSRPSGAVGGFGVAMRRAVSRGWKEGLGWKLLGLSSLSEKQKNRHKKERYIGDCRLCAPGETFASRGCGRNTGSLGWLTPPQPQPPHPPRPPSHTHTLHRTRPAVHPRAESQSGYDLSRGSKPVPIIRPTTDWAAMKNPRLTPVFKIKQSVLLQLFPACKI